MNGNCPEDLGRQRVRAMIDPFDTKEEAPPGPSKHWKPTEIEVFIISQLVTHGREFVEKHLRCTNREFSLWSSQTHERRFAVNRALRAHAERTPAYIQGIERTARQWMRNMRSPAADAVDRVYDWHYLEDLLRSPSTK